jgi:hypothetical protein
MRGFPGSEITALVNLGMSPFLGSFDHGFGSTKRAGLRLNIFSAVSKSEEGHGVP